VSTASARRCRHTLLCCTQRAALEPRNKGTLGERNAAQTQSMTVCTSWCYCNTAERTATYTFRHLSDVDASLFCLLKPVTIAMYVVSLLCVYSSAVCFQEALVIVCQCVV
jgi:hypothetical protein